MENNNEEFYFTAHVPDLAGSTLNSKKIKILAKAVKSCQTLKTSENKLKPKVVTSNKIKTRKAESRLKSMGNSPLRLYSKPVQIPEKASNVNFTTMPNALISKETRKKVLYKTIKSEKSLNRLKKGPVDEDLEKTEGKLENDWKKPHKDRNRSKEREIVHKPNVENLKITDSNKLKQSSINDPRYRDCSQEPKLEPENKKSKKTTKKILRDKEKPKKLHETLQTHIKSNKSKIFLEKSLKKLNEVLKSSEKIINLLNLDKKRKASRSKKQIKSKTRKEKNSTFKSTFKACFKPENDTKTSSTKHDLAQTTKVARLLNISSSSHLSSERRTDRDEWVNPWECRFKPSTSEYVEEFKAKMKSSSFLPRLKINESLENSSETSSSEYESDFQVPLSKPMSGSSSIKPKIPPLSLSLLKSSEFSSDYSKDCESFIDEKNSTSSEEDDSESVDFSQEYTENNTIFINNKGNEKGKNEKFKSLNLQKNKIKSLGSGEEGVSEEESPRKQYVKNIGVIERFGLSMVDVKDEFKQKNKESAENERIESSFEDAEGKKSENLEESYENTENFTEEKKSENFEVSYEVTENFTEEKKSENFEVSYEVTENFTEKKPETLHSEESEEKYIKNFSQAKNSEIFEYCEEALTKSTETCIKSPNSMEPVDLYLKKVARVLPGIRPKPRSPENFLSVNQKEKPVFNHKLSPTANPISAIKSLPAKPTLNSPKALPKIESFPIQTSSIIKIQSCPTINAQVIKETVKSTDPEYSSANYIKNKSQDPQKNTEKGFSNNPSKIIKKEVHETQIFSPNSTEKSFESLIGKKESEASPTSSESIFTPIEKNKTSKIKALHIDETSEEVKIDEDLSKSPSVYDAMQTSIIMISDTKSNEFPNESFSPLVKQETEKLEIKKKSKIFRNEPIETVSYKTENFSVVAKENPPEKQKNFFSKFLENSGELSSDRTRKFQEISKSLLKAYQSTDNKQETQNINIKSKKNQDFVNPSTQIHDEVKNSPEKLTELSKKPDSTPLKPNSNPKEQVIQPDPNKTESKPQINQPPIPDPQKTNSDHPIVPVNPISVPKPAPSPPIPVQTIHPTPVSSFTSSLFTSYNPYTDDSSSDINFSDSPDTLSPLRPSPTLQTEDWSSEISSLISSEITLYLRTVTFKDSHKEVDPSLEYIMDYLNIMANELKENENEVLDAINTPAYQDPLIRLAQYQDPTNSVLSKFPTLELILPPDLCAELKVRFDSIDYPTRQIYLQMLFDCVNEALNYIRPFGIAGIPEPWSEHPRILFGEAELENVFNRVIGFVLKWFSSKIGIYLSEEKEERVESVREERMSGLLCMDVKDEEHMWIYFEEEETQTKIVAGNSIFEALIEETVQILIH